VARRAPRLTSRRSEVSRRGCHPQPQGAGGAQQVGAVKTVVRQPRTRLCPVAQRCIRSPSTLARRRVCEVRWRAGSGETERRRTQLNESCAIAAPRQGCSCPCRAAAGGAHAHAESEGGGVARFVERDDHGCYFIHHSANRRVAALGEALSVTFRVTLVQTVSRRPVTIPHDLSRPPHRQRRPDRSPRRPGRFSRPPLWRFWRRQRRPRWPG
jgi:hypothetical protein